MISKSNTLREFCFKLRYCENPVSIIDQICDEIKELKKAAIQKKGIKRFVSGSMEDLYYRDLTELCRMIVNGGSVSSYLRKDFIVDIYPLIKSLSKKDEHFKKIIREIRKRG